MGPVMRFPVCAILVLAFGLSAVPPGVASEDWASGAMAAATVPRLYPALFGTREAFSPDNSAFFKWTGMLARFAAEQRHSRGPCGLGMFENCEPAEWRQLIGELRGLSLREKIVRVNDAVNRHPYIPSMANWGESNHWETPFEFFRKSGQCQDYAITKYMLLRAAGVPAAQLRLVVLRDTRLGLDHAVTVAYVDGTALLLDNQLAAVVPADSVLHYQPYYSINEQGWWLHRGPNARYAGAAEGAQVE